MDGKQNSDMPEPKTSTAAPPAGTANAGAHFEPRVGAFYLLALLLRSEPRGLPGATAEKVAFQQSVSGYALDDIVVHARMADGSPATLEIQAKRTLTFTASDAEFSDVVRQMLASVARSSELPGRHTFAVAIARTTTKIEQSVQEVLHWARELPDAATFSRNMALEGFASEQMRTFVATFTAKLREHGDSGTPETVWRMLRRFQILVFDFESVGSDYDQRARERAQLVLDTADRGRAGDLWVHLQKLTEEAARASGTLERPALVERLTAEHGLRLTPDRNLGTMRRKQAEDRGFALAQIRSDVGGARLARQDVIGAAREKLETARLVNLQGVPGVGKSWVLKHLAELAAAEGEVVVIGSGRLVPGGWVRMAHELGCPLTLAETLNELGAAGGSTLFIDNIDQIEGVADLATVSDLLVGAAATQSWRVVVTTSERNADWADVLPPALRANMVTLPVGAINNEDAAQLAQQNPALRAILRQDHPAGTISHKLFYLAKIAALASIDQGITSELDLARLWWAHGGGKTSNDPGRIGRQQLLQQVGDHLLQHPGRVAVPSQGLDAGILTTLLQLDAVRENSRDNTVTFAHDVLRDWVVGLMVSGNPGLMDTLDRTKPLSATLSRDDASGGRWRALLRKTDGETVHGSWRRPILLAPLKADGGNPTIAAVGPQLVAHDGALLIELLRLLMVVEAEPLSDALKRLAPTVAALALDDDAGLLMPKGPSWAPAVTWLSAQGEALVPAAIPEAASVYLSWLMMTSQLLPEFNAPIVTTLFTWLGRIEEALEPRTLQRDASVSPPLGIPRLRDTHQMVRMAAYNFAVLSPAAAADYLTRRTGDGVGHDVFEAVAKAGSTLAKAAPGPYVDFFLAGLLPPRDDEDSWSRRSLGPFDHHDFGFSPPSPRSGPFSALLAADPAAGLRLVREIVAVVSRWRAHLYWQAGGTLPTLELVFADGVRTFDGDASLHVLSRGAANSSLGASALMALEEWAHRRLDVGERAADVLADVLGPAGGSGAFVAVAVDLVLSHPAAFAGLEWPFLTSPMLLKLDHERLTRDVAGFFDLDPISPQGAASDALGELTARPSRTVGLLGLMRDLVTAETPIISQQVRPALEAARDALPPAGDDDPIWGLAATAARAVRMCDKANWSEVDVLAPDGNLVREWRYVPDSDDAARMSAADAAAARGFGLSNLVLSVQMAFKERQKATPDLVESAVAWAQRYAADPDQFTVEDSWEAEQLRRTEVMSAVLAVREANSPQAASRRDWALPLLVAASAYEADDLSEGIHVEYHRAAIAAVGLAELYRHSPTDVARDTLLSLALRKERAVALAMAGAARDLRHDRPQMAKSLLRLLLGSARYVRHSHDDTDYDARIKAEETLLGGLVDAERAWIACAVEEPAWPTLPHWYTRRRRGIRLPGGSAEAPEPTRPIPEVFPDEQRLAVVAATLIPFCVGARPCWLMPLVEHLFAWAIAANTLPDGEEAERRPNEFNYAFFELLGIVCAMLPWNEAEPLLERITKLADDAFCDAAASLVAGFDRALLSSDASKPDNPENLRKALLPRVRTTRFFGRLKRETSNTCEVHLGALVSALFFQKGGYVPGRAPYVPDQWPGIAPVLGNLADLTVEVVNSSYVATLFLRLMARAVAGPEALAVLVRVADGWTAARGADVSFWITEEIGTQVCRELMRQLVGQELSAEIKASVIASLNVMTAVGVVRAREIEELLA